MWRNISKEIAVIAIVMPLWLSQTSPRCRKLLALKSLFLLQFLFLKPLVALVCRHSLKWKQRILKLSMGKVHQNFKVSIENCKFKRLLDNTKIKKQNTAKNKISLNCDCQWLHISEHHKNETDINNIWLPELSHFSRFSSLNGKPLSSLPNCPNTY